ncbi:hypothetical protein D9M71_604580 [compost metagenome]
MNERIEGRVIVHRTAVRMPRRALEDLQQKVPQPDNAFAVYRIEMRQVYGLVDRFPGGRA